MNASSISRKTSGACAGAPATQAAVGTVQALGKDEIPEGLELRPLGLRSAARKER
jgi:hypothetical protein